MSDDVAAHDQTVTHHYVIHYPEHPARTSDPHYVDFNAYHTKNRPTARCAVGLVIGFDQCSDAQGHPLTIDGNGQQSGLELHHAHIEFALQNGISLTALESVYPGISNPSQVGAWVESGANLMWLCAYHHRGHGGAHTASASDWEAEKFVRGLIT